MTHVVALLAAVVATLVGPGAAATAAPAPVACVGTCWRPTVATTFMWQLDGVVTPGRVADVYDVDSVATPVATVRALQARGRKVVCYMSAGSWEEFRADAGAFPASIIGEQLEGWPGERWLDVRRIDLIRPLLRARIAECAAKGFDGVEFDNVDAFQNESGFPITAAHQLRFNRFIANEAHRAGLAVALKNDPDQVAALVRWFDFAVVEQCFQYEECERFSPFVQAGKPVYVAEYELPLARFCAKALALRFHAARYPLGLDGRRWACARPR